MNEGSSIPYLLSIREEWLRFRLTECSQNIVTPAYAGVQDIMALEITNMLVLPGAQQKPSRPFVGVNIR